MADRERIIASVFSRRNASGRLEESYVSHVKVWEEAEGGRKPRYILLARRLQYILYNIQSNELGRRGH